MPKGKQYRKYSGEFKQQVVEAMKKEGLSYSEAARQFGVSTDKRVSWKGDDNPSGPPGQLPLHKGAFFQF